MSKRTNSRSRRSADKTLGVVITRLNHPFYADLLRHIQESAFHGDYSLMFRQTNGNIESELASIRGLGEAGVEGLILLSPMSSLRRLNSFFESSKSIRLPIVAVNSTLTPQPNLSCISVDQEGGMCEAVQHLLDLGHRNIAYLSGPAHSLSSKRRRKVYKEMMEQAGSFRQDYIIPTYNSVVASFTSGYKACNQLLEANNKYPTAIMAFNDLFAVGAIRAIHDYKRHGLKVPY